MVPVEGANSVMSHGGGGGGARGAAARDPKCTRNDPRPKGPEVPTQVANQSVRKEAAHTKCQKISPPKSGKFLSLVCERKEKIVSRSVKICHICDTCLVDTFRGEQSMSHPSTLL